MLVANGPGLARESWEENYKAIFDRVVGEFAVPPLEFPFTFHAFSKEQKSFGSFTPIKGLAWSQKALTGEIFSAGLVNLEGKEGVVQLRQLLARSKLNQIVKWDTANWQPRFPDAPIIFNNILRDIDSMTFSPVDPTKLAVSGRLMEVDKKARSTNRFFVEIFDLNRPSKNPVTIEAGDFINHVVFFAWSPDGKKIAVVSRELAITRVQVHDVGTGEVHRFTSANQIKKLAKRKFPGFIGGIDWSPDGKMLAISVNAGGGPSLEIWDADLEGNLDEPAATIALDIGSVKALDWGPNNLRKVDNQFDSKIALAGLAGFQSRLNIIHVGYGKIKEANKKINVVAKKEKFDAHLIGGVQDMVLAWSPDGQRLATGISSNNQRAPGFRIPPGAKNGFGEIKIWDSENFEKELDTLKVDQRSVQIFGRGVPQTLSSGVVSLAWRKDKKMLAAGIQDGTIRVFDKIK